MKLKNILLENNNLIPFIDHEKTFNNAKEFLKTVYTIITSSGFYEIQKIEVDKINQADFLSIVHTKIENNSEKYIYRLLDVVNRVFDINEKIYFYYHYLLGYTNQQLRYGETEDCLIINNTYRLEKQICKKIMFSIQDVIEYKNMLIEEE